ncbi:hypothetical protein [Fictibacillus sp. NRS-1165]|uniref:hypothetical protein n=1 Tax=Fictibacillus sp. NRS-1165 TaxID=3144463 RepID=UPI003D2365FB
MVAISEDPKGCEITMATCLAIIANLSQLFEPCLLFYGICVQQSLGIKSSMWKVICPNGPQLSDAKPLFERIDLKPIGGAKALGLSFIT